ncbi:MAG: EAL domain-containing protein [Lachnospiraceae bacterium]|nr:EAL domain-containing protein [Lachnospiraceae bacterium]
MEGSSRSNEQLSRSFTENMMGGACIWHAKPPYDFLYINDHLIDLFECDDERDFRGYTGGNFSGVPEGGDMDSLLKEIHLQLSESVNPSGYVFFNILTKKGNSRRIVNHWTLCRDENGEEVFYDYLFLHKADIVGNDFDSVTGLYGKTRLAKYFDTKKEEDTDKDTAVIYLNLIHFKLLNLEKGASEGDECLRCIADVLRKEFKNDFIARIADDHFAILADYDEAAEKASRAGETFHRIYGSGVNVQCKFGICRVERKKRADLESALSKSKVACDYIKNDSALDIVEYSSELAKKIKTRKYVADNLDNAIKNGWIQVYYQPVIRSITDNLCGMESLVRWVDPTMGFLSPDQFISILEDERLIHKLDSYMIEKVCSDFQERVNSKKPMIPVSINFSRLDFILADMFEVVENAVKKYDVPRDYIHIEITESMIASDEDLMREIIEKFRTAGYEVWMDDFGSGYSSLTLLKDYNFDMLKLDMRFLTPFTAKSKSIVTSTITMAKNIDIMTLAEGVETKEQLDFLKEVGCDMIQGYYYGKPEPVEDVFRNISGKKLSIETRRWRHFYEVAGRNIRSTDYPLEIVEDDGKEFRTLFMNPAYKAVIKCDGKDVKQIDEKIYYANSPLLRIYREIAEKLKRTGKEEAFYYPVNGNYYCFKGQMIAQSNGKILFRGTLSNISGNEQISEIKRIDSKLRDLNLLFEEVLIFNTKELTLTPVFGTNKYVKKHELETLDSGSKGMGNVVKALVHVDDWLRCMAFLDTDTMDDRFAAADKGYLEDAFRLIQPDGNYEWTEHYLMQIPGTNGEEYLYCVKPFAEKSVREYEKQEEGMVSVDAYTAEHAMVWENIIRDSSLIVFWKDIDRRFKGVSRAFLEYFGNVHPDAFIGKTAEELKILFDPQATLKSEEELLKHGKRTAVDFEKCQVRGEMRTVFITKLPIYDKEKIVGLVGFLVDWENEKERILGVEEPFRKDSATGLADAHAFVDALISYAQRYHQQDTDYAVIVLNNTRFEYIKSSFGDEYSKHVMRRMADTIVEIAGDKCVISRARSSIFAIVTTMDSEAEMNALTVKLTEALESITEVEGNRITLRINSAAVLRSKTDMNDEAIFETCLKWTGFHA